MLRKTIILLLFQNLIFLYSSEFIYEVNTKHNKYLEYCDVKMSNDILIIESKNNITGSHLYRLDKDYNTQYVEINTLDNKKQILSLKNDSLYIDNDKLSSYSKSNDIWLQCLINQNNIIKSKTKKDSFFMINYVYDDEIKTFKKFEKIEMVWKNKKKEVIKIMEKDVSAIYMVLTINDFRGLFWKAEYWFRLSDGVLLKYRKPTGPLKEDLESAILVSESE